MLYNTQSTPSKFKARSWVKINDELQRTYKDSNQTKFKTSMIRSHLCDRSDAYIFISGTITIKGAEDNDAARQALERLKGIIYIYCVPITDCISNINVTQIDYAKNIDFVMPMYNSTEYIDNYSKRLGGLRQYYRHESNDDITESESFKPKIKITAKPPDARNTKILKY